MIPKTIPCRLETIISSEKYYTVCGAEFGSEFIGKLTIIVRADYGIKSAGDDFRNHLHNCMEHLVYES